MNIRKAVDYSTMFATLESVMKADLPQMELYCEIGKAVCAHSEKGAAVAAAEFIKEQYTEDFEATWQDVLEGCQELMKKLIVNELLKG